MPQKIDADEARAFLCERLMRLLNEYGSGASGFSYAEGWRVEQVTSDAFTISNADEPHSPKFLVSVEVSR